MRIRIDPADKWFSLCVRERAGNRCEACSRTGVHYRIDCSHLFSRRHNATRWEPTNAFSHCFLCHQRLGGNPVEFTRWAESKLGPAKVESLRQRHLMTLHLSKADKIFIARHYQMEYKAMQAKREAGNTGYLHFRGWGEA